MFTTINMPVTGFPKVHFLVDGATAEYPATIIPDCTCAHIFKRELN